jgi:hypothetical protein
MGKTALFTNNEISVYSCVIGKRSQYEQVNNYPSSLFLKYDVRGVDRDHPLFLGTAKSLSWIIVIGEI